MHQIIPCECGETVMDLDHTCIKCGKDRRIEQFVCREHYGKTVWSVKAMVGHKYDRHLCKYCAKHNPVFTDKNCAKAHQLDVFEVTEGVQTTLWECPDFVLGDRPAPVYEQLYTDEEIVDLAKDGISVPPKEDFSCNTCDDAPICEFAWDLYNTQGDCVASK